jgi:hypothetical protein
LRVISLSFFALDNLYIADYFNQCIRRVSATAAALSFPTTNVGSAASAQDVTVSNTGNASLNISAIAIAANFNAQGADTSCNTSAQTLAAGASCVLGIEFLPTQAGTITGSVILTDNALNASNATQTIALQGAAMGQGYALTVLTSGTGSGTVTSSPAGVNCGATCSASYASGTAVTLTATVASRRLSTVVADDARAVTLFHDWTNPSASS